jgi:hypothetical protein
MTSTCKLLEACSGTSNAVAELRSDELNKTYCRNPEDQKSQTAKL